MVLAQHSPVDVAELSELNFCGLEVSPVVGQGGEVVPRDQSGWVLRAEDVWETLGLPVEECVGYVESSEMMRNFRSLLFTRIVPTIKDIGLWGPKIRRAYANMGILGFADVDTEELGRHDERVAEEFDARTGR